MSVYCYWGKAKPGQRIGPVCHLLAYHSLDVAAAGKVLLEEDSLLRSRLVRCSGLDEDRFIRWATFFLAIHDLGKFSDRFQKLRPDLVQLLGGALSQRPYNTLHDSIGWQGFLELVWFRAWQDGWFGLDKASTPDEYAWTDVIYPWASAVMGHHGKPPELGNAGGLSRTSEFFDSMGSAAAVEFAQAAAKMLLRNADQPLVFDDRLTIYSKRLSWFLAGLTVLCDWIGSSTEPGHFEYEMELRPLPEYWAKCALPRARKALEESGVLPSRVSRRCGVKTLFPKIKPSPLQKHVSSCGLTEGPQLFILEDATGSGKTEAALALAHRIMAASLAEGVFLALPTMATSNAMYDRVAEVYRQFFSGGKLPSLVLAHSSRHLSEEFEKSIRLGQSDIARDDSAEDSGAQCAAWLADNRKKSLLASFGVGTIDQALIAILPARHQSLRLLGLGRSVLIVDEVHACDPYMHILLRALLKFHAAQGGSAILLSATLPLKMRRELAGSFCKGLGLEGAVLTAQAYPLVTHVSADSSSETAVKTRKDIPRTIKVNFVHSENDAEKRILNAVNRGACACWMRNTVADVRSAYERLAGRISPERLILFHARFTMGNRLEIENKVKATFGKESSGSQRAGKLLIATQVVEQSLDLDFDFIVSDLAPMDRLIQRFGRLHRHKRDAKGKVTNGKDCRSPAEFVVLAPSQQGEPKLEWYKDFLPKASSVYPWHGRLWLTAKLLADRGYCLLPQDARDLVEKVFGDNADDFIPKGLLPQEMQAEGEDKAKKGIATLNALKLDDSYESTPNTWLKDVETPTRLGEKQVSIRLAKWDDTSLLPWINAPKHSWDLSQVEASCYWIAEAMPSGNPALAQAIEAAKESMPDKCKWAILVAMRERSNNVWEGAARDREGRAVTLLYNQALGLSISQDKTA
ncbi:MAG: CRISPR-associated helicase Cas3' [Elusimicrobia bacterium]|nr:CRISPR-associated helicase Cas3' [Elusimicrobiota bacterium]